MPSYPDKFSAEKSMMLDTFSLKVLALLICKGDWKKEDLFIDLVADIDGYVTIDNPKLKKSIKKILYFSEIMPKKYYDELRIDVEENI